MHLRLAKNFPDMVITSVLGSQDEFLNEFIQVRQKRGIPRFIWVGATSRLDKLKAAQRQLIDATLSTPIQPDVLIQNVCQLFELDPADYLQKYRTLMSGGLSGAGEERVKVSGKVTVPTSANDPVRAQKYKDFLQNVPALDTVFSTKSLERPWSKEAAEGNTPDLLEKKKKFVKALLKK